MWQTHSINSYLNSSTRNKWKTVVHTAWTHNCNFRSPEQCVEMLLKHFFVCSPFCGKFLCCIFQANVAVERQPEYLVKISSISLILVDWPFCCMEATFWQGDEVKKVILLMYMNLLFYLDSWVISGEQFGQVHDEEKALLIPTVSCVHSWCEEKRMMEKKKTH